MILRSVWIVGIVVLAACSSGDEPITESTTEPLAHTTTPTVDPTVDVSLDSVTVGGDVSTFVPAGWNVADDGLAVPPADHYLVGRASWRIDDRCASPCEALSGDQWQTHIGSEYFDPAGASGQVVSDVTGDGERRMELSLNGSTTVLMSRWVDGARGFILCEVTGPTADLNSIVAAFDFACDNTRAALDGD